MDKKINSFLKLGYFLDYENPRLAFDFSNIDKEKYAKANEHELIEEGSRLWLEAIEINFNPNDKHLVPISGGLDSRAILAGLLRFTEAKNIHTYTFGTPKTLDYEIGCYVAKKLGTIHSKYDLTQYIYTQEELENISTRIDRQTILFHHPPVWQLDKKYKGHKVWSGFLGDPLSGSKLKLNIQDNEVNDFFIKTNSYTKSIELDIDLQSIEKNIFYPKLSKINITKPEQADFFNRQLKFIEPAVLIKGFDYNIPFLYQPWIDFILSVPNRLRENQYLYKEILLHTFPREFSWKTKANLGLPLSARKYRHFLKRVQNKIKTRGMDFVGTNYLDFNYHVRNKPDLRQVISSNIYDLKNRNIVDWIDPAEILNAHLAEKGDHADALITLASLEIHLKTGLKI